MKNIHAYTEPGHNYPAYVSINELGDGAITVALRQRAGTAAVIELTRDQLIDLAEDVLAWSRK